MRYMLITGDHPRHLYFANKLADECNLVDLLLEEREAFIPKPAIDLDVKSRENFIRHFHNRAHYEEKFFGREKRFPNVPVKYVSHDDLVEAEKAIQEHNPEVIFVFGTLSLARKLHIKVNKNIKWINLNTGLMQRYNGDATLFWPFYFLEPQWAGSTFHILDDREDSVSIVHQSVPTLKKGDTIHEVASKVLVATANDVKKIIECLEEKGALPFTKIKLNGKLFESSDFRAEHLALIYNLYDDRIVDHYLDGDLGKESPNIITIKM